jgi:hypothetical protein
MKSPIAETVEKAADGVRESAAAAEGEQSELFQLPFAASESVAATAQSVRKAGRPPGAENKSSRQLREWLLGRGVLPQAALMQWVAGGPDVLWNWVTEGKEVYEGRAALRAKVWEMWKQANVELGAYLLPKMQPVDDAGRAIPAMVMFAPGGQVMTAVDGKPPWEYLSEQNQEVSEAENGESQKPEMQE